MIRAVAALLLLLSTPAFAGTTITWQRSRGDEAPTTLVMKCEGGNARFDTTAQGGSIVVWDDAKKTLNILKPAQKTYTSVTEAQLGEIRKHAEATYRDLEKRLNAMPPAERAQMEAMMMQTGLGQKVAEWKFTPTGKKSKVGPWPCELYEGDRGGQGKTTFCMAPWATAPVKKEEFACLKNVVALFGALAGGSDSDLAHEDLTKFPGLPLQTTRELGEGKTMSSTVKAAARAKHPAETFAIPAGYTQSEAAGGMPP